MLVDFGGMRGLGSTPRTFRDVKQQLVLLEMQLPELLESSKNNALVRVEDWYIVDTTYSHRFDRPMCALDRVNRNKRRCMR